MAGAGALSSRQVIARVSPRVNSEWKRSVSRPTAAGQTWVSPLRVPMTLFSGLCALQQGQRSVCLRQKCEHSAPPRGETRCSPETPHISPFDPASRQTVTGSRVYMPAPGLRVAGKEGALARRSFPTQGEDCTRSQPKTFGGCATGGRYLTNLSCGPPSGAERERGSARRSAKRQCPPPSAPGSPAWRSGEKDTVFLLRLEFLLHC